MAYWHFCQSIQRIASVALIYWRSATWWVYIPPTPREPRHALLGCNQWQLKDGLPGFSSGTGELFHKAGLGKLVRWHWKWLIVQFVVRLFLTENRWSWRKFQFFAKKNWKTFFNFFFHSVPHPSLARVLPLIGVLSRLMSAIFLRL